MTKFSNPIYAQTAFDIAIETKFEVDSFTVAVYPTAYVASDSLKFYVYGQKIKNKNGIGSYHPNLLTQGKKTLQIQAIVRNPFTNRNDAFHSTRKIEVY
jgi:hypothetical protein